MRWIAFTLALLVPVPAVADQARCKALFAAAPARIAGLPRTGTEIYNPAELGFQVKYETGTHLMSVYFYDMGHRRIGPAIVDAQFRNAMYEIQAVAEMRGNRLKVEATGRVGNSRTFAWVGRATERTASRTEAEFAAMGQSRECLVKVRLTSRAKADAGAKVLSSALGEIDAYVNGR
jgi:hypothetical protein